MSNISLEPICEQLEVITGGNETDPFELYRYKPEPMCLFPCNAFAKRVEFYGGFGVKVMKAFLSNIKPYGFGMRLCFSNGALFEIVENPELLSLYERHVLSSPVVSICVEMMFSVNSRIQSDLLRTANALGTIFAMSSHTCVEVRIKEKFCTVESSKLMCNAVVRLKRLKYLGLDSISNEAVLEHLSCELCGKLPDLRYLYVGCCNMWGDRSEYIPAIMVFKEFLVSCKKLVYLRCFTPSAPYDLFRVLIDSCEQNPSIQVFLYTFSFVKTEREEAIKNEVYRRLCNGKLRLLDIVLGTKIQRISTEDWDEFFCFNKEMRELHKLIFSVETNSHGTDVIFQVLAEMGKKRYGILGIYDLIREEPSSMLRLLKKCRMCLANACPPRKPFHATFHKV
jgi:hypothetical protein